MTFDPDFASPAEWARLYRTIHIQVVPAWLPSENKSWKRPLLPSWTEYQHALVPDSVFEPWYGPSGQYVARPNMGAICGIASDNLMIIDLDDYKTVAAAQWWHGLLELHHNGMELETVEQRTGGGGRQKLFRCPSNWTPPTNETPIGVDIRGQGGFAMLAPSIHESGKAYEWLEGRSPDEIEIAMAPDWLMEAVDELVSKYGSGNTISRETRSQRSPDSLGEGIYDGFGNLRNLREKYMTDTIWATMIGLRVECPIPPGSKEREAAWQQYERHVRPKDPSKGLDDEGRGRIEFNRKWDHALKKWEGPELAKAVLERQAEQVEQTEQLREQNRPGPVNQPISGPLPGIVKLPPIEWLDMSNWDSIPVPTRKWAILDRVPLNQVGLFSGEGGAGKSLIELMKNVAHVTGQDWLGSLPEQGGAFYLGAEDEAEEIHIRLDAIARHYKTTFKALVAGGLKVLPLLGRDSMLCVPSGRGNHIETTPLYRQLYEAAGDLKPKNISIDTLSRAFGGDEINRVQVYAFAMHMQALAKVAQGSVTILSHPSLAGIATGTGLSGSTAWHGAFRFRQYLKGIKADEDADPTADDLRELVFKKNQYGPSERPIILRYKDGLFLPVNGTSDPERVAREARVDGLFIKLLRHFLERGDRVTHQPGSQHYYAPRAFSDEPEAKQLGFRKGELEDAMKRLITGKRVLIEIFGKESRRQVRLVLAPGT